MYIEDCSKIDMVYRYRYSFLFCDGDADGNEYSKTIQWHDLMPCFLRALTKVELKQLSYGHFISRHQGKDRRRETK